MTELPTTNAVADNNSGNGVNVANANAELPTLSTLSTTIITVTDTVTELQVPKRVKKLGRVDFVRFDSKETVYAEEQDDFITQQIKEEIKR